jgi:hypothetical protein
MKLSEQERSIWVDLYGIHERHRGMALDPDNFPPLTKEVSEMVVRHHNNRLAIRLGTALINYFEDMYQQQLEAQK